MLYSEAVEGRTRPKSYKLTVTSKDNQTADKIKEMLKSNINPTEIKVEIGSLKTLRDGRVQIETGSIQEAETLTNNIKDKLGDKMETKTAKTRTENTQHPRGHIYRHPNSTEPRLRHRKRGNHS